MRALVLSLTGAYGVHLVYTALVWRWTGIAPGPRRATRAPGARSAALARAAGFEGRPTPELLTVVAVTMAVAAALAFVLFGGVVPTLAGGAAGGALPAASARSRRGRVATQALEAWPRMIEEIRIAVTTVGRSVPQALFETGERAPAEMRPAFEAAQREWLLGTDFPRALAVLKAGLADATADTVCETLLVANEIGGTDVDRCLAALADDRVLDLQSRKDAAARQAGARFARRFVLVVPLGMALVGLTIGDGRSAYRTPTGELLVGVGLAIIAACWLWAGRIMRLPREQRVFGA